MSAPPFKFPFDVMTYHALSGHILTYKMVGTFPTSPFNCPHQWNMFAPPLKFPFDLMTYHALSGHFLTYKVVGIFPTNPFNCPTSPFHYPTSETCLSHHLSAPKFSDFFIFASFEIFVGETCLVPIEQAPNLN